MHVSLMPLLSSFSRRLVGRSQAGGALGPAEVALAPSGRGLLPGAPVQARPAPRGLSGFPGWFCSAVVFCWFGDGWPAGNSASQMDTSVSLSEE